MPISESDYKPSFLFKNGHINTIISSLYGKTTKLSFIRKRIETPDADFLDIDCLENGNKKVVLLCHGLEGSSSSKYILRTASLFNLHNFDVIAINYRGCSGEINKKLRTYHSGETEDLNTIINTVISIYETINLIGFSLGGNIVLKYLGDGRFPINPKLEAAVAISTPIDLHRSALELSKGKNRLYSKRFLKTLSEKIRLKHKQFPQNINLSKLRDVNNLIDFDNSFTSPINGFKNALDYYEKCNSKQFIHAIKTPTLLINALDDPFLSTSCYPYDEAINSKYLNLMTPKFGGHIGFFSTKGSYLWHEKTMLTFIQEH